MCYLRVRLSNDARNLGHELRGQRHPAPEVQMPLNVGRVRRAREVVQAGGERLGVQLARRRRVPAAPPET